MKKRISEMTFRQQIGAAAKYGAWNTAFSESGFRTDGGPDGSVTITPHMVEDIVRELSSRDVNPEVRILLHDQPGEAILAAWDQNERLELRANLVLGLGEARDYPHDVRRVALARTYEKTTTTEKESASPYLNGTPAEKVPRSDLEKLFNLLAERISQGLATAHTREITNGSDASDLDDFLIEAARELHLFPASTDEKLQVAHTVTVTAMRDGMSEYRYSTNWVAKGRALPEIEIMAGVNVSIERLVKISRAGVTGYEYQVVIPLATPMDRDSPPRTFSWITRSTVTADFFESSAHPRAQGFKPSRPLRSATLALQFPLALSPEMVSVVTNVRDDEKDRFDPTGETLRLVDGYVEKTWTDLRLGRYSNLVWPR